MKSLDADDVAVGMCELPSDDGSMEIAMPLILRKVMMTSCARMNTSRFSYRGHIQAEGARKSRSKDVKKAAHVTRLVRSGRFFQRIALSHFIRSPAIPTTITVTLLHTNR